MNLSELLILRHGYAEDYHPEHPGDDAARRLTGRGEWVVRQVGHGIAALGLRPEGIWHSPYARASQTAAILGEVLAVPVAVHGHLAPSGSNRQLVDALADLDANRWLVVGHNPGISDFAARYASVDGVTRMSLEPTGIVWLRLHPVRDRVVAELAGLYPPRVFERLVTVDAPRS